MSKLIILGILGMIGLIFVTPVAEVSFDGGETYNNTPVLTYMINQFSERCVGYVDSLDKCEFKLPFS